MLNKKMNRIYQGRVSKVEISDGKNEWKKLDDGESALWQHHEFFQDTVNYDFAGLAAMIDETVGDAPLNTFKRAVIACWQRYDGRKGQWDFPFANAIRALGLPPQTGFDDFSKKLFEFSGTRSTPAQRHAAVRYIFARALQEELQGEGDAAQKLAGAGRDNWPKLKILCSPKGLSGTTPDTVRYQQEKKAREAALRVESGGSISLEDAYAFKTSPERKNWTARQTRDEIKSRFESLLSEAPELQTEVSDFNEWLTKLPADFCVASPGKKPQGDFDAALLFALRPNSAALKQVFIRKTKWRRENSPEIVENDAVADARVDDIPVFPFLTNLVCIPSNPKKPSFAVWPDFEKLAFIEVFTKIGQLCLEHRRRTTELLDLNQKKTDYDVLFDGDERIKLLRELTEDLAGDRVDEEGHPLPYRIRSRSLKVWSRLRDAWRIACADSTPETKTLLDAKNALQKKSRERFGNATLYEALALPTYRSVWLTISSTKKSSDPLRDWADYVECLEEIEHLESDPAFTPAHAKHSPRFFRWAETNNKEHESWDGKSDFIFIADALDFSQPRPVPTEFRVSFRAPRLIRDGLRCAGEKMDHALPDCDWLPPVLRALPAFHGQAKQSFARVAIRLMPKSNTNIQLALEPELENEGWKNVWKSEHEVILSWGRIAKDGEGNYRQLKWPAKPDAPEAEAAWFKRGSVTCLAVDLGIRESGAFKVLQAAKDGIDRSDSLFINKNGKPRFSRVITPQNYFSKWLCLTVAEGLLRLRGEDALIYRLPTADEVRKDTSLNPDIMTLLPEFSGRHGRRACTELNETSTAEKLFQKLQYPIDRLWPSWKTKASFPEQNDELLRALSGVRSRLYRLHRWAWMLSSDEKRRMACLEQIEQIKDDSPLIQLRHLAQDANSLANQLDEFAKVHLAAMTEGLVEAANRILPSKRGKFKWLRAGEWHEMRLIEKDDCRDTLLAGQRGLSTERLTQLQSLRQLVQSLNHLCRHEIRKRYQIPKRGSVPDPFMACGDALEDAREDRAKQIAHLILAKALGVELAPPPADKKIRKQKESLHGVYQLIPNRHPVDFIALEDLSKFRTSEIRGRRENRQLAAWSHRRIVKHLVELCELVGLPIAFVDPAFTSRLSARNGGIGFRAAEIQSGDSTVSWLDRRAEEGDANAATLLRQLQCTPKEKRLLIPRDGGPVFVELRGQNSDGTAQVETKPAPVVHADLNGAHRIGLRALAHLDAKEFHSQRIWIKESRKRKGSTELAEGNVRYIPDTTSAVGGETRVGYPFPLVRESESLWEKVDKKMAWKRCLEINAARLKSWGVPEQKISSMNLSDEEDDIPM